MIGGIMISAAITSLVTGVTEPIELPFLFVAPLLFALHALLTGVSLALAAALNVKIGFGFSAGLIDYLLNFGKSNTHNPLLILVIGAVYAVLYYMLFRFLIRRFNIPTPGREPDADEAAPREPDSRAGAGAGAGAGSPAAAVQPPVVESGRL